MIPKESLAESIMTTLKGLGVDDIEPAFERPADMAHGDLSTNIALVVAKRLNMSPRDVAERIVRELADADRTDVDRVEIAGPGFINFYLGRGYFLALLKQGVENLAQSGSLAGKTVLVEYTQPNILKPFHIGHLMSNAIGESLSRLLEYSGADVKRLNYQGDVGLHIPKALWGIKALGVDVNDIHAIGTAYAHGAQAYESDEQAKAEIDELNKRVYEGDPEVMELYEAGKKTSLARFEELYTILGTKFDRYYLESEVWRRGLEMVQEGKEKGIFVESDGATVFPGEQYGLHTRVFVTSKGLPVYEAKELGLADLKSKEFDFDLSFTTTAVEQEQYFQVVFKALGLLRPELDGKFTHVPHGMMQLANGKMSSRLGNVITGESLIDAMIAEVKERMGERVAADQVDSVATDVGVAAIKYSVLRQAVRKNIIFDEEKSLSFEGDSGPYIQYTAVRARSVVAKAREAGVTPSFDVAPDNVGAVERLVMWFPAAVDRATRECEPHHIATYLIELSSAFNSWYAQEKIVDVDGELSSYRVALTDAVGNMLERGLWLLGIRVPAAM